MFILQESVGEKNEQINSFHLACCELTKEEVPAKLKEQSLYTKLEESCQKEFEVPNCHVSLFTILYLL